MSSSFWRSVQSMNWWSLTQSSVCQLATRRHGCILAPNTGISLIMSQYEGRTDRMSEWQRLYVVQTAGQITGLLSANSTSAFRLHGDNKARKCQRDWMSLNWNKTARGKPSSMICSASDAMKLTSDDPKRTGQSSETPSTLQQWIP